MIFYHLLWGLFKDTFSNFFLIIYLFILYALFFLTFIIFSNIRIRIFFSLQFCGCGREVLYSCNYPIHDSSYYVYCFMKYQHVSLKISLYIINNITIYHQKYHYISIKNITINILRYISNRNMFNVKH